MHSTSQVFVTLSPDLLRQLCELARTQDVPIQWIVAGLICDTIDTGPESAKNAALPSVKRVAHQKNNRQPESFRATFGAVRH